MEPLPDSSNGARATGIIAAMRQRVLIVDDDAAIRETTGDYLSDKGFEVAFAADGVEIVTAKRAGNIPA